MEQTTLPTFIIGGAPRSGTTFLAEALSRHPEVYMARPLIPEPKVFLGPPQPDHLYLERYAALFQATNGYPHRGEKSSGYLESADAGRAIHRLVPGVKLLFIFREPVARAYSNYLWSTKNGFETLPFDAAIALEGKRPSPRPNVRPFDYLCRGDYARLCRPYLNIFGPERVRFFLFEELRERPHELFRTIQDYLGLSHVPLEKEDVAIVNSAKEIGAPLDPRLNSKLRETTLPMVRDFARVTGLDVSAWGYAA
jgi:hypothetical protein